ncbi:MAG: hypothetical protein JWR10_1411 [Rubritepida sp.]|nr:hypothetical protein [Rubritepida sp.]
MLILTAFLPFLVFAVADRTIGVSEGLIAGAATSLVMLLRDLAILHRTPKILQIGTLLLFGGLALYTLLGHPVWSMMEIRLRVDLGLLAIVVASLAIRQPFTLQYARESVPRELWGNRELLRTADVITAIWALAFLAMVLSDLMLIDWPEIHPAAGIVTTVAALWAAVSFTGWYPTIGKSSVK